MALRYVVYDTDTIPTGDRIPIINGTDPIRYESFKNIDDRINALEITKGKFPFSDLRYFEIKLNYEAKFDVWEILQDEQGYEYSNLITHTIEINKRINDNEVTIILKSTNPIKNGYIQFY